MVYHSAQSTWWRLIALPYLFPLWVRRPPRVRVNGVSLHSNHPTSSDRPARLFRRRGPLLTVHRDGGP